jgi:hypothetical protein
MKKVFLVLSIFATILTPISFTSSAYADGCSSDNPCASYASVDSNGVVTNTMVCQASVCGNGGSWNSVMPSDTPWAGQKIVLQNSTNPDGSGQALGGYNSSSNSQVTYNSQSNVFTLDSGPTAVSQTKSFSDNSVVTKMTVVSSEVTRSFQAPSSVTSSPIVVEQTAVPGSTAKIYVTEINNAKCVSVNNSEPICETVSQSISFTVPQTAQQILRTALNNKLTIIQKNIDALSLLVKGVIIK